jgi:hypothetical protein
MEINAKDQAALFAKLARVAGKIGNLEKTGTNTHFNYKFVEENAVSDTVRRLLSDEGIAFFASMDHVEINTISTPNNKGGETLTIHAVCTFTFTFADGETGATFACRWHGEAKDQQDKAINKAATAALKYYLLKNFMISTGKRKDDPDTDSRLDRTNATRQSSATQNAGPKPQQQNKPAPTPNPPQASSGSVLDTGFSVETGRNFLGWAKRNYGLSEDGVSKILDVISNATLGSITQFPGTVLDAVVGVMLTDLRAKNIDISDALKEMSERRNKFIAPHGKPFTLVEVNAIGQKMIELAKGE